MIASRKPPQQASGALMWVRANLFNSLVNSVLTLVLVTGISWLGYQLLQWIFGGAHWQIVWNNAKLLAVYRYPNDLLWRPLLVVTLVVFLLGMSTCIPSQNNARILRGVFWSISGLVMLLTLIALPFWEAVRWNWLLASLAAFGGVWVGRKYPELLAKLPLFWLGLLLLSALLIYGIIPADRGPLRIVDVRNWGGFLLTVVITTVGILVSFPLGVFLALGRRSNLPIIKFICIGFIELIRGAPLVTWLFMASLLVPMMFNVSPDSISPLMRALVAVTLFSAAYMAENVRGGLQAIPKGQEEAARALGLSGWQTTYLIVLPQALRAVIPPIVSQAIGLFKGTSLVFIIGLFDFFNVANQAVANQPETLLIPGGIRLELSLLMVVVYFFFAYRMSVASRQIEKNLGVGER